MFSFTCPSSPDQQDIYAGNRFFFLLALSVTFTSEPDRRAGSRRGRAVQSASLLVHLCLERKSPHMHSIMVSLRDEEKVKAVTLKTSLSLLQSGTKVLFMFPLTNLWITPWAPLEISPEWTGTIWTLKFLSVSLCPIRSIEQMYMDITHYLQHAPLPQTETHRLAWFYQDDPVRATGRASV